MDAPFLTAWATLFALASFVLYAFGFTNVCLLACGTSLALLGLLWIHLFVPQDR